MTTRRQIATPNTSSSTMSRRTASTSSKKKNNNRGVMFPLKLHQLLCEAGGKNGYDDVISWLPDGKSFKVHDRIRFANEVMPAYFGSSKFRSFQKNLNMWQFSSSSSSSSTSTSTSTSKGRRGKALDDEEAEKDDDRLDIVTTATTTTININKGAYYHPFFVRDAPSLCHRMMRQSVYCRRNKNLLEEDVDDDKTSKNKKPRRVQSRDKNASIRRDKKDDPRSSVADDTKSTAVLVATEQSEDKKKGSIVRRSSPSCTPTSTTRGPRDEHTGEAYDITFATGASYSSCPPRPTIREEQQANPGPAPYASGLGRIEQSPIANAIRNSSTRLYQKSNSRDAAAVGVAAIHNIQQQDTTRPLLQGTVQELPSSLHHDALNLAAGHSYETPPTFSHKEYARKAIQIINSNYDKHRLMRELVLQKNNQANATTAMLGRLLLSSPSSSSTVHEQEAILTGRSLAADVVGGATSLPRPHLFPGVSPFLPPTTTPLSSILAVGGQRNPPAYQHSAATSDEILLSSLMLQEQQQQQQQHQQQQHSTSTIPMSLVEWQQQQQQQQRQLSHRLDEISRRNNDLASLAADLDQLRRTNAMLGNSPDS